MDKKLTLKLDADIIERAKKYAKDRGVSVSRLVENHLSIITKENIEIAHIEEPDKPYENSPLVKKMKGLLTESDFEGDEKYEYIVGKK